MRVIIFGGSGGEIFFWEGIAAIVIPFLPFFFIPTMLKSALSGLGVVGAALTGIASGARNAAARGSEAIQNTERMRSRMADAQQQTAEKRATKVRDAMLKRNRDKGGTDENLSGLTRGEKRRLNEARKTLNQGAQLRQEYNRNTGTYFAASDSALENKAFEEETAAYSSLLSDGKLTDDDGNEINITSTGEGNDREEALRKELSKPADQQNKAKALALYRSLASEGKEGYDSIARVLDSGGLQRQGAANNILNELKNDTAIKDKAPGLYKAAIDMRNSTGATIAGGQVTAKRSDPSVANSIKGENIPSLTTAESAAFFAQTDAGAAGASLNALTNAQTLSQMDDNQKTSAANQVATHILDSGDAKMAETFLNNENAADYLKQVDNTTKEQIQNLIPVEMDAAAQATIEQTLNQHINAQRQSGPTNGAYDAPVGFDRVDIQHPDIVRDKYGNKYNRATNTAEMYKPPVQNPPHH